MGYISSINALSDELTPFSCRINTLHTHVYVEPDVRANVIDQITLGSYVNVIDEAAGFSRISSGGYVFSKHITRSQRALEPDYVYTAGKLLGVPYLWGGRTPFGLDAPGLIQLSLDIADIECMRDCDEQCEAFGQQLPTHWRDFLWRRGDLVFFSDHVGIMADSEHIIHAEAHTTKVAVEPLVDLVLRGREITAIGRP